MKLEKITDKRTRRYDDSCAAAHALDLIGDRWTLLIIRELLLGPRRFGEMRESLPGISANVMTQRLETLESAGIVVRRLLPPPARVQVYELTPWGLETEALILALGRWGARSHCQEEGLPLSAVSAMLSFKAMFRPELAAGTVLRTSIVFGEEAFTLSVRDRMVSVERGRDEACETTIESTPGPLLAAVYGLIDRDEACRNGSIRITGDAAILDRLAELFGLPQRYTPPSLGK